LPSALIGMIWPRLGAESDVAGRGAGGPTGETDTILEFFKEAGWFTELGVVAESKSEPTEANRTRKPVFSSTKREHASRSRAPFSLRCPSNRSVETVSNRSVN
jgi:hypothetical protein